MIEDKVLTTEEVDLIEHLTKNAHVNTAFGRTNSLLIIINKLRVALKERYRNTAEDCNYDVANNSAVLLKGTAYGYDGCDSPSISLGSIPDEFVGKRVNVLVWLASSEEGE